MSCITPDDAIVRHTTECLVDVIWNKVRIKHCGNCFAMNKNIFKRIKRRENKLKA